MDIAKDLLNLLDGVRRVIQRHAAILTGHLHSLASKILHHFLGSLELGFGGSALAKPNSQKSRCGGNRHSDNGQGKELGLHVYAELYY
jgi:hypothetical protein